MDVQGQRGERSLDVDGQGGFGGGGGLKNWIIFMDVICVSSLRNCKCVILMGHTSGPSVSM